ncbi:hypothetical protein Tco_1179544, partial [Tanacetum coccineum]
FLQSIMALAVAKNPLPTSRGIYDLVPSTNPRTFSVFYNTPIFSILKKYNGIKFTQDPKSAKVSKGLESPSLQEGEVLYKFLRFLSAFVTKLATGRMIDGVPCGLIDMVIKDLDLEPNIDAMARDFLELESVECTSVLHQSDGVGSQRYYIVPLRELNGVSIALVAWSKIIS